MPFLARMSGRPVRWVEERREHVLCSCHSRDQRHDAEIAFDGAGRILAVRDRFVVDCGAWNPVGVAVVYNTAAHLPGPYRIPHFSVEARVAATNKAPNAPYRGAGRPEAVQVMERLVDLIATELKLDPVEVRRRNMIRGGRNAVRSGHSRIATANPSCTTAATTRRRSTRRSARHRRRSVPSASGSERRGRPGATLGLGVGCYTEGTGVGSFEGATVRIEPRGRSTLLRRVPAWPGHGDRCSPRSPRTLGACSRRTSSVSFGDTAAIPMGFGTLASRTTVTVSAAIQMCERAAARKVFAIASHTCSSARRRPRTARRRGWRRRACRVPKCTLGELARASRPGWDHGRPPGVEPGLEATHYYRAAHRRPGRMPLHAAIVEVDIDTGCLPSTAMSSRTIAASW